MILYTEKQLRESYKTYIENLTNSDVPIGNKKILHVPIPTLEEFRIMYEDYYSKFHIAMNKKDILIKELETIGIIDPVVRWIPNNPMGRKTGKVTGWVFRSYEDKFGKNLEITLSQQAEAQNIAIVSSTK